MVSRIFFSVLFLVGLSLSSFAQAETESTQYDPLSSQYIPRYEQHYKYRVWWNFDLTEKQNKGFFANRAELSRFIIDAVKSGEIENVYHPLDDSLLRILPKEEFNTKLVREAAAVVEVWDPDIDYYSGDLVSYNGKTYSSIFDDNYSQNPEETAGDMWELAQNAGAAQVFDASEITKLQIMEDIIFDRRRSRVYHDILGIKLIIPGTVHFSGNDDPVCYIRYQDLEKAFRNNPEKAVWFNRYNQAQHKNFADAFLLRLFHLTLHEVENPDSQSIFDIYAAGGRDEAVMATVWEEMKLMEKEHNLWEY